MTKEVRIEETEGLFFMKERPDWCPIKELPPHGRLIDADKLFARVTDYYGTSYTIDMICEAPTIIPAEEA